MNYKRLFDIEVFGFKRENGDDVNVITLESLCFISSLSEEFFHEIFSMCDNDEFFNENFFTIDGIGPCVTKSMVEFFLFALGKYNIYLSSPFVAQKALHGSFDALLVFAVSEIRKRTKHLECREGYISTIERKSNSSLFELSFNEFKTCCLGIADVIPFARDISLAEIFPFRGYVSLMIAMDRLDLFTDKSTLLNNDKDAIVKSEFGDGSRDNFSLNIKGLRLLINFVNRNNDSLILLKDKSWPIIDHLKR